MWSARRQARWRQLDTFVTLKNSSNIASAVQDANDMDGIFCRKVVNADDFKSRDRPYAQVLKPRIVQMIMRTGMGMLA